MVRVIQRKIPLSPEIREKRANKYYVYNLWDWIDPYPEVPGTKPEKMIYAELVSRGIDFQFQQWIHVAIPDLILEGDPWYKPDFIIPSRKIIIEANGAYWHSQPAQIEKDSYKYALYEMMGYKVLIWWDYDIETHLVSMLDEAGLFHTGTRILPPKRADGQTVEDGKASAIALGLKHRKPWTKKPISIRIKGKRKTRRGRR